MFEINGDYIHTHITPILTYLRSSLKTSLRKPSNLKAIQKVTSLKSGVKFGFMRKYHILPESGSKYFGKLKFGLPHGKGTEISLTYKYVGEFRNGSPHGKGNIKYAGGDKYVGQFHNGKMHGNGVYHYSEGDKYIGQWKNDKKHGQGTYKWSKGEFKGDTYVGQYKNDKKHGHGKYTYFSLGLVRIGKYKEDESHGRGTYYFKDGTIKKGIWKNGKLIKYIK